MTVGPDINIPVISCVQVPKESNLKFDVLSSIMLCCKYLWLCYKENELKMVYFEKPIYHILEYL